MPTLQKLFILNRAITQLRTTPTPSNVLKISSIATHQVTTNYHIASLHRHKLKVLRCPYFFHWHSFLDRGAYVGLTFMILWPICTFPELRVLGNRKKLVVLCFHENYGTRACARKFTFTSSFWSILESAKGMFQQIFDQVWPILERAEFPPKNLWSTIQYCSHCESSFCPRRHLTAQIVRWLLCTDSSL